MKTQQQTIPKNLPVKFLVAGRTASGKSTIVRAACERLGLKQVKSLTTRPPRITELNNSDCDHYFVSDNEFIELKNSKEFAAYTEINGYKYATTFEEIDNSDIYVIDPNGIEYLKEHCKDKYKFIEIYIRVPYLVAQNRYIERGGTGIEFKRRYEQENLQFKEYENSQQFDFHILNDGSIEESVDKICEIIKNNTMYN